MADTPKADLSSLRDETTDDNIPQDLPEQGGGSSYLFVPPTKSLLLRLPADLMQCWEPVDEKLFEDLKRTIPKMDPATGQQQVVQRIQWTFDKDHPLTIVAPGNPELDGQPCPRVTVDNIPKTVRGGYGNPEKPKVAPAVFMLRTALGEPGTTLLNTPKQWVTVMAQHAGHVFRVETGLSTFCNPEKVRYIPVPQYDAQQQVTGYESIEDPSGVKGCGKSYYTPDFKHNGAYLERVQCQPGKGSPKEKKATGCGAYLRGFFRIEQFLPPL